MTMRANDSLIASPRGNRDQAISYFRKMGSKRIDDVVDYINAVYELAPQVHIDPAIVIAQASHETGAFSSYWWQQRLNPAGIGITGDPAQNNASRTFRSGREAARAHIAHLQLYATGKITSPFTTNDDPRWGAYKSAYGERAVASTIAQLANKWAVDSNYASGITRHGNAIFPSLEDSKAPQEPSEETPSEPSNPPPTVPSANIVKDSQGKAWDGLTTIRVNDIVFRALKRTVTCRVDSLNARKYANTNDDISPVLEEYEYGDKIEVLGWTKGEKVSGEDRWWITTSYLRVWIGGTSEKPL